MKSREKPINNLQWLCESEHLSTVISLVLNISFWSIFEQTVWTEEEKIQVTAQWLHEVPPATVTHCSQVPETLPPTSIHVSSSLDFRFGGTGVLQGNPAFPYFSSTLVKEKYKQASNLLVSCLIVFPGFFVIVCLLQTIISSQDVAVPPSLHIVQVLINKKSSRSEISPPNSRRRMEVHEAQTVKQSISVNDYHPNPDLKQEL